MIKNIEPVDTNKPELGAKVTLLEGVEHGYQDNDTLKLKEVVGMEALD